MGQREPLCVDAAAERAEVAVQPLDGAGDQRPGLGEIAVHHVDAACRFRLDPPRAGHLRHILRSGGLRLEWTRRKRSGERRPRARGADTRPSGRRPGDPPPAASQSSPRPAPDAHCETIRMWTSCGVRRPGWRRGFPARPAGAPCGRPPGGHPLPQRRPTARRAATGERQAGQTPETGPSPAIVSVAGRLNGGRSQSRCSRRRGKPSRL